MLGLTPFKYLPRSMQAILCINLAVYLLTWLKGPYIEYFGALMPSRVYEFWRFLSYAFIHFDFMHILINMLMFWMFATEVCKTIGERSFTTLYLVSAVFAGVFSVPFYEFGLIGPNPIIGASGALFGVMVAYAFLFPERLILMFFIIPMKIKHAIWVFIAIDLFMINSGDLIAHFTHLGGALSGYLFMLAWSKDISLKSFFAQQKKQESYSKEFFRAQAKAQSQARAQAQAKTQTQSQAKAQTKAQPPLEGQLYMGSSNSKEARLNEILEKINHSGLQSLSKEERDYLQWFGQQNRKGG